MRRLLPLLLSTLLCYASTHAQPVKTHGQLHVAGTHLLNAKDSVVTLRGMSLGWHCFWPAYYSKGTVDWLTSDWKIDVVRAALGIEPGENSYLKRPDWSEKKMRTVIEAAIRNDIYVIIDWHSHNINLPEAKAFFTKMAKDYGHHPHVIYEIFNEPDEESWADVKAYSEEIIRTIRAIDPDNVILVGTPHWDQDVHLAADDPIRGFDNLMYTLHFYAATHKQFLRDRADYAISKGLPLFISESAGMEATGDGPLNVDEWNRWIDWAEAKKISWITWSVSDKDETCSVLKAGASGDGKWKEKDLKQSGILAREMLRKKNGYK